MRRPDAGKTLRGRPTATRFLALSSAALGAAVMMGCAPPRLRAGSEMGNAPRRIEDPVTGMEFVLVPGGTFTMGDGTGSGEPDERPAHEVRVCDFHLGTHEVTQAQWQRLMGRNPAHFQAPDHPVESVSWNEVQEFLARLGGASGRTYRLPTEAEWEYAAREGKRGLPWAGAAVEAELPAHAWFGEPFPGSGHHPVGQKRPNALGLHDMSGNVREWTASDYESYARPPSGRRQPGSAPERVYRGGAWNDPAARVRTGYRGFDSPEYRDIATGFRVAFDAGTPPGGGCGGNP